MYLIRTENDFRKLIIFGMRGLLTHFLIKWLFKLMFFYKVGKNTGVLIGSSNYFLLENKGLGNAVNVSSVWYVSCVPIEFKAALSVYPTLGR